MALPVTVYSMKAQRAKSLIMPEYFLNLYNFNNSSCVFCFVKDCFSTIGMKSCQKSGQQWWSRATSPACERPRGRSTCFFENMAKGIYFFTIPTFFVCQVNDFRSFCCVGLCSKEWRRCSVFRFLCLSQPTRHFEVLLCILGNSKVQSSYSNCVNR